MTPDQRQARARGVFEHIWHRVAPLYGQAGQPAPDYLVGGNPAMAAGSASSDGTVRFAPWIIKALARRPVGKGMARREADGVILHELAHHYQDPGLVNDPNTNHREEAAELFATYFGHKMFGTPSMTQHGRPPYGNRPAASRDLASTYGKGYWRRRQFTAY